MMRSSWVDDVLGSTNIVGRVVEPGNVMLVHPVILDNDSVDVVFIIQPQRIFRCVDSTQYMVLQFRNKVLHKRIKGKPLDEAIHH